MTVLDTSTSRSLRTALLVLVAMTSLCAGCSNTRVIGISKSLTFALPAFRTADLDANTFQVRMASRDAPGDPLATFIAQARDAFDGDEPRLFGLEHATLVTGTSSSGLGVDGLGAALETVEVFVASESAMEVVASQSTVARPAVSLSAPVTVSTEELTPLRDGLLADEVDLGIRGLVREPPPADFSLQVDLELDLTAYR